MQYGSLTALWYVQIIYCFFKACTTPLYLNFNLLKVEDMQTLMSEVRQSLGELPIVDDEMKKAAGEESMEDESVAAMSGSGNVQKLVTADGTYATQSAFSSGAAGEKSKKAVERPPLRKYLMEGDFFIGAALGSTMTKLALRFCGLVADQRKQNRFTAESMLVITSVMHLGVSGLPEKRITKDDLDRLNLCLKVTIHFQFCPKY